MIESWLMMTDMVDNRPVSEDWRHCCQLNFNRPVLYGGIVVKLNVNTVVDCFANDLLKTAENLL